MNKQDLKNIGKQFRTVRIGAGYSLDEVAKYLMVSKAKLSRFENGLTCLTISEATDAAKLLGVDVSKLIGGKYVIRI